MSDTVSRRELLRNAAVAATLGGFSAEAAQHVHNAAAEEKKAAGGVYKPTAFTAHEYRTLQRLAELIMPPDDTSKSALEAGAPEFIDLLASANDELLGIYTGGIAWLDRQSSRRYNQLFAAASPQQQTELLDLIAYRKNASPELNAGIRFFDWARKMVADAYYSSKVGVQDLGFKGNVGMRDFQVPVAALEYAVKKSPA